MKEIVKPIILSHKRWDAVDTLDILPEAMLCIPKSQEGAYRENYPDTEILTHPDTVVGFSPKIRWVYEKFPNVLMLDDDLFKMSRNYVDLQSDEDYVVKPGDVYDIVQATAFLAKEFGAKFFGFSTSTHPVAFNPMKPFKLTGYVIGGAVGFLEGFHMELPDKCVAAQDYFLSGINAYFHRYCLVDERYTFASKEGTFKSKGGMADHRTNDTEKADYDLLLDYFGSAIQRKKSRWSQSEEGWFAA